MEQAELLKLCSYTLACERFPRKHSGANIVYHFDQIMKEYGVKHKVEYIITDNAANMKKAFNVSFRESSDDDTNDGDDDSGSSVVLFDEDDCDGAGIWQEHEDIDTVHCEISDTAKKGRLSCFAHTLQLCVKDGLEQVKSVRLALSKL